MSKALLTLLASVATLAPESPSDEELDNFFQGEYYEDYSEEEDVWGVFHTETDGHMYSSWCDKEQAQKDCDSRNEVLKKFRRP